MNMIADTDAIENEISTIKAEIQDIEDEIDEEMDKHEHGSQAKIDRLEGEVMELLKSLREKRAEIDKAAR